MSQALEQNAARGGSLAATAPAPQAMKAPPQPAQTAVIVVLALWFGLLTGFFEVGYHLAQRALGNYWFLFRTPQFVWITPLFDAAVLMAPALVLVLLSVLAPKAQWTRVAILLCSAFFFCKVLVLFGSLHWIAISLLVLGLSVQAVRLLPDRRIAALYPFVRLSTMAMVSLVVAVSVSYTVTNYLREQQDIANLPPAPAGAPNVLVVVWDTVGAENLSLHGHRRGTTPQLKRWANKGVCFRRAIVPASWTLPAHASMFTGLYPHEHTATWWSPLNTAPPTLAEALRDEGYSTAGFVANKWFTTTESGLARGFIHYEDYAWSLGEAMHCSEFGKKALKSNLLRQTLGLYDTVGRKTAADVNKAFLNWLDYQDKDRPFFAFVNYFDAHDPYLPPPPPFQRKFNRELSEEDKRNMGKWLCEERQGFSKEVYSLAEDIYDSAIAYMDNQLDALLKELQQRGELDNTIVIITSDHGEHFGEHGLFGHGQSLYRSLVHVPLVVIYPKHVPTNTVVNEFVTLRDLAATVTDLAKADQSHRLPGNSWRRYWDNSSAQENAEASPVLQSAFHIPAHHYRPDFGCSPVAQGSLLSLFHDGKYYIKNLETGLERIYDFEHDPQEQHNLATSKQHRHLLEDFRRRVDRVLDRHKSRWLDFP